jgi:inner membrane protein
MESITWVGLPSMDRQGPITTMNPGSPTKRLPPMHQAALFRWLAGFVAKRGVSLALAVAVVIIDRTIRWHAMAFVPQTLIAGPCHLASALVVLGAITRFRAAPLDPKFGWSMMACSVLIDIDHLPLVFGSSELTNGTPRPYTHSLAVVVVLIVATVVARSWSQRAKTPSSATTTQILAGVAWGVGAHFLRDVATASMPLWWPVTKVGVEVPYWWYMLALLVIIAIPLRRPGKGVVVGHPDTLFDDEATALIHTTARDYHAPSKSSSARPSSPPTQTRPSTKPIGYQRAHLPICAPYLATWNSVTGWPISRAILVRKFLTHGKTCTRMRLPKYTARNRSTSSSAYMRARACDGGAST